MASIPLKAGSSATEKRAPTPPNRIRIVAFVGILAVWETVSYFDLLFKDVIPSFLKILLALYNELITPEFYTHLSITMGEILGGFVIAATVGVGLGIWMGARRYFGQALDLYISSIGATPKIIFLPIAMIFFGVGPESKLAMSVLGGFFPIALNTYVGMLQINPVLIKVGRSFNLSRRQMVTKVYLPSLYRPIVVGMRLGLGGCLITAVLAEAKIANHGIGFLAIEYYSNFKMAEMYALLLLIFILAGGANYWLTRLADRAR